MSKEIILNKIDNEYIGAIPHLSLIVRSSSAESVYSELNAKREIIEKEWEKSGLSHLLKSEENSIKIIKLEKKFKTFILLSLFIYFIGLIALGLVVKNSAKRISSTWGLAFKEQTPERKEKSLNKFKDTLQIYKPYIKEVQKVLNEKDSD